MARTSNRGSRNNNPEGHNQYNNGWVDTAKERPMATAAAAAAAVGAGVFLWSRRNQISDQISNLSNQISDWSQSGGDGQMAMAGEDSAYESANRGRSGTTGGRGMSETGDSSTGSSSGRGRARSSTPTS